MMINHIYDECQCNKAIEWSEKKKKLYTNINKLNKIYIFIKIFIDMYGYNTKTENENYSHLPPNFDKYLHVINYLRENGVDCLKSTNERRRFYIGFKHGYRIRLNLMTRTSGWINFQDPNCSEAYNIYDGIYTPVRGNSEYLSDHFLFNYLLSVDDSSIESYLSELQLYLNVDKVFESEKKICIISSDNQSKIIIKKNNFIKYCGYNRVLRDYKDLTKEVINEFTLPVKFNENVSLYFISIINEHPYERNKWIFNLDELEQIINVTNTLEINMKNMIHLK